jgi:predicted metal-binding transcription factor (methanogenesis marker protein 9)
VPHGLTRGAPKAPTSTDRWISKYLIDDPLKDIQDPVKEAWHEAHKDIDRGMRLDREATAASQGGRLTEAAGKNFKGLLNTGKTVADVAMVPLAAAMGPINTISAPIKRWSSTPGSPYSIDLNAALAAGRPGSPKNAKEVAEALSRAPGQIKGGLREISAIPHAIENEVETLTHDRAPKPPSPPPHGNVMSAGAGKASDAERKVARYLFETLKRDQMTPEEFLASVDKHSDRPVFMSGGDNMRGSAIAITEEPGPGRTTMSKARDAYEHALYDKIKNHIADNLGGKGDFLKAVDALDEARRRNASAAMRPIENLPVTLTPDTVAAMRSKFVRPHLEEAADLTFHNPQSTPEEKQSAQALLAILNGEDAGAVQISVRHLQDVSRDIRKAGDAAFGGANPNYNLGKLLSGIAEHMRENATNPALGGHVEYGNFLRQYGNDMANIDAVDLGKNALRGIQENTSAHIERELEKLKRQSPDVYEHYKKGLAEAVVESVEKAENPAVAMKKLRTPETRNKIMIALGNDGAALNEFYEGVDRFVKERATLNGMRGDFLTSAKQSAKANMSSRNKAREYQELVGNVGSLGSPGKIAGAGIDMITNLLAKRDSEILADEEANALMAQALSDPKVARRLLTDPRLKPRR